jgi:hypothetical protein
MFGHKKKNDRAELDWMNRGFRNLDQMKEEINLFMRVISHFLHETAVANLSESTYVFNTGRCKLSVITEIRNFKLSKGSISCYFPNARLVYEFDAMKNVINRSPGVWQVQDLWEELPELERCIRQKFRGTWTDALQPIQQASLLKP